MEESLFVSHLIQYLESSPETAAEEALKALSADASLSSWHPTLRLAQDRQRVIHRDASYSHPNLERVVQTLRNKQPANAADLTILVLERLAEIDADIRSGPTDDWRQFWNEDSNGKALDSKSETSCRDALLSDLRRTAAQGVSMLDGKHHMPTTTDRTSALRTGTLAYRWKSRRTRIGNCGATTGSVDCQVHE